MHEPRVSRLASDFCWPGGRHVAIIFNVAWEAWSEGKAPGIGPMGNPLPAGAFDANALSWGNYGTRPGIERLLRILDRNRVRASVMVSGVLAERAPDQVRAVAASGHEIVAHSWAQDMIPATLSAEENRANILRTTTALEQASGTRPKGWISPRGTAGSDTLGLLAAAGYEWHSDVLDGDKPYLQHLDGARILAIPFTMDINDLPHAMRYGRTPRQFVEIFDDFVSRALDRREDTISIDVTAHAHCYGRPGGAWAYEEIVRKMARREDVWVTTRQEIADVALQALA